MKITIITLFPEMFTGPFGYSIVKRACDKKFVDIDFINIRDYGVGKHKIVDDTEYGGGIGMILKIDVLHKAIKKARRQYPLSKKKGVKKKDDKYKEKIVLLSASGKTYNQKLARKYSKLDHLILICGHYEGIDDRIKNYIDEEISIGDFILTGGEIPAMLITDSIIRLIKGVLPYGATIEESFTERDNQILLEYPHYTKPRNYENNSVPEILLSGNHKKIKQWRELRALNITKKLRPDLIKKG